MEAIQERGGHTYLVDGTKLLAYIKVNTVEPEYFTTPLRFDRRGRKFDRVSSSVFQQQVQDHRVKVEGSKGNVYFVDVAEGTCTCPGYTYHGTCKHVKALIKAA